MGRKRCAASAAPPLDDKRYTSRLPVWPLPCTGVSTQMCHPCWLTEPCQIRSSQTIASSCLSSSQVVQELSSNLIVIEKLQSFQYKDPNMRDHGENVRHRAKQLCELVMDPERVREERKKVVLWCISCSDCQWGHSNF